LLVRGRLSDVLSEEGAREFLALAPHARYADVSGAGHMVAGDRNDAFTTAVAEFLRGLP
jgi:pimeloyl-ACP methyl ester carboxylesterase